MSRSSELLSRALESAGGQGSVFGSRLVDSVRGAKKTQLTQQNDPAKAYIAGRNEIDAENSRSSSAKDNRPILKVSRAAATAARCLADLLGKTAGAQGYKEYFAPSRGGNFDASSVDGLLRQIKADDYSTYVEERAKNKSPGVGPVSGTAAGAGGSKSMGVGGTVGANDRTAGAESNAASDRDERQADRLIASVKAKLANSQPPMAPGEAGIGKADDKPEPLVDGEEPSRRTRPHTIAKPFTHLRTVSAVKTGADDTGTETTTKLTKSPSPSAGAAKPRKPRGVGMQIGSPQAFEFPSGTPKTPDAGDGGSTNRTFGIDPPRDLTRPLT